jgi:signal peptidase I
MAAEDPQKDSKRSKKRALTGFGVSLLCILAFAVFGLFNFKTVVVSGPSMLPTLKDGTRVLTTRAYWLVGPLRDKDIVVIKSDGPTGYIIKRVNAMAGEPVSSVCNPKWDITRGQFHVPAGSIWVIGDNFEVSEDSREFGAVSLSDVLGKVIVWP